MLSCSVLKPTQGIVSYLCGIVVMKTAHWNNSGLRLLMFVLIDTGHGGRDRMIRATQRKYANISTNALELFKSMCEEYLKKGKRPVAKGVVVENCHFGKSFFFSFFFSL